MSRKAQIWSMDFAASLVIFTTAMAILLFAWVYISSQSQQQAAFMQMETGAMSAADSLARSTGVPEDWNLSTVASIGLASRENVLNETKVGYLLGMQNETVKSLLGIGNYDFYLEVRYTNGSLAQLQDGSQVLKGNYPENASITVPSERYVIIGGEIARMKFILWV